MKSVTHIGTGLYGIVFSHSISGCGWVGSIGFGTFGGSTGPSEISITGRAGTTNALFVQTFGGESAADLPWHVIVVC